MKAGAQKAAQRPDFSDFDGTTCALKALVAALDERDGYVAGHSERLAWLAVTLGVAMGLEGACLENLYRGGYLHDIGKIGIPDKILLKPGRLTAQEWVTMRSHPARGERICRHLESLSPVLPVIRHHHERWDGTGYPDGLKGEQIPLPARILQVADIYDALTSPRPYKPAVSHEKGLEILQAEAERGWRDSEIVRMFVRLYGKGAPQVPEASLAKLGEKLAADAANERTSFRPLQFVPAGDSRAEAGGRSRRG